MTAPTVIRISRPEWLSGWLVDNNGLCRICNAAQPDPVTFTCPTGCDLEAAYQRGGWRNEAPATPTQRTPRQLVLTCAKDVEPEDVEWLWEGWLPRGKLVAVDGAPGIGKTAVALDLIARATRGDRMPGADLRTPAQTVLIAGVEDGWADTIRPRLDAAKANLDRVHFVTVSDNGIFTVPDDVQLLADAVRSTGAGWVHIDAIMGTLAETVRVNSDHDVRRAFGTLKDMAQELRALITFIRHPKKAGASNAVDAGGGSIGISAISRAVLFAGFDPTDQTEDLNARRRVLASGKTNLGRIPSARSYQLIGAPNGRPCVAWGDVSTVTADDMASAPMRLRLSGSGSSGEAETKQSNAAEWLADMLAKGVQRTPAYLTAEARAIKLSWRTVERAAKDIGVLKVRGKVGEPSVWYLSERPATVAPSTPDTANVGGTVTHQETLLFPVPPAVAPSGGTGATPENEAPGTLLRPSRQTLSYARNVGGTGETLGSDVREAPDEDDGYLASLLADESTLELFGDAA